jgi:Tol biopolymer transport system component
MRLRWAAPTALCAALLAFSGCGSTTLNPTPTITTLYPDTLPASGANCSTLPTFVINLQGTNFLTNSVAYWNASSRPTVFNQDTEQLAVTLKACDISAPGVAYVTVSNPPPGGGLTLNGANFQITQPPNPVPQIMSLAPASTPMGTLPPGGILTINGPPAATGSISPAFVASSVAAFNGSARNTTFVSATELQVQMLASDVAAATTINVTVSTPTPGGGVANAQFTVTDPPNAANFPQVISVNAAGGAANGASSSPAMSADGRYVAFYSEAKNLVASGASGASGNIFVRDTCVGATNCTPHTIAVDLAPDGSAPNADGGMNVALSSDGRYVAFESFATNLMSADNPVPVHVNEDGDADRIKNVFVRDLCVGPSVTAGCTAHTSQISNGFVGDPPNDDSYVSSMSSDGRFIAFATSATNLVPGGSTGGSRIYVADLCTGSTSKLCSRATYLASVGNVDSDDLVGQDASLSSDGRYIAFSGWPVAAGDQMATQIYLRDMCRGKAVPEGCTPHTMTVSVAEDGSNGNFESSSPSVSADGRFVVFKTLASNLVPAGPGVHLQVLLRDTCLGSSVTKGCVASTSLVSIEPVVAGGTYDIVEPSITPSGRYIGFGAISSVLSDSNAHGFVRDTCFGAENSGCVPHTILVSVTVRGELENGTTTYPRIVISADGRIVSFGSSATNLAAPTSGLGDVFLMLMPTTKP